MPGNKHDREETGNEKSEKPHIEESVGTGLLDSFPRFRRFVRIKQNRPVDYSSSSWMSLSMVLSVPPILRRVTPFSRSSTIRRLIVSRAVCLGIVHPPYLVIRTLGLPPLVGV